MAEFKYEVGDRFHRYNKNALEVVGRRKANDGGSWYWVTDADGEPSTFDEIYLNGWTKIKPFFEEGDTFEITVDAPMKGEVLFVTEDRTAALVKFTYDRVVRYDAVTDWTYRKAENIKHRNQV
jgi:hypothetical protein